MRAAIYCRISVQDENVAKVSNQEADCRKLCLDRGYEVAAVFTDDGYSASLFAERPGYLQMLSAAQQGKFEIIVAVAEDRLSRQPMEKLKLSAICAENRIVWDTVRDGKVDPASDEGELFSFFRGWTARKESRDKSARQRAANAALTAKGIPLSGGRCFGFEPDRIKHREEEASEIRWAYSHILAGGSVYGILKRWNTKGIRTARNNEWCHMSLMQLLRRTRNAAITDEGITPQWEPVVSKDDFEAVQAILAERLSGSQKGSREQKYLLAGIARCGVCGQPMASGNGSDAKHRFNVYNCSSKRTPGNDKRRHPAIKVSDLDPLIVARVVSVFLLAPTDIVKTPEIENIAALHTRLSVIRDGLKELVELIGTEAYDKARFTVRTVELKNEESEIVADLESLRRSSAYASMIMEARRELFAGERVSFKSASVLKVALKERFESLPLEMRRTLVRSLLQIVVNPYVRKGGGKSIDRVEIASSLDDSDDEIHEDVEDLELPELLLK